MSILPAAATVGDCSQHAGIGMIYLTAGTGKKYMIAGSAGPGEEAVSVGHRAAKSFSLLRCYVWAKDDS
jgi:hypothetical protein